MEIEQLVLGVAIVLTIVGILTCLAIAFVWERAQRWPVARASGTIIAVMRALAALSAILSSSQAMPQTWTSLRVACIPGWLVWEIAGLLVGWRADRQKKTDEDVIKDLELQIERQKVEAAEFREQRHFLNRLLTAIRNTVLDKSRRIREDLTTRSEDFKPRLDLVRKVLDPKAQAYLTLERMGAFLRESVVHLDRVHAQTFRIGLYVAREGTMKPEMSWDVSHRREVNFSSSDRFAERFALNSTNPSFVVRCVTEGTLQIVTDCADAPGFYFDDKQRSYLKSLIAHPILPYGREESKFVAAIVIDTNRAGYFREEDREIYCIFMEEFAVRLDLECLFSQLFGSG